MHPANNNEVIEIKKERNSDEDDQSNRMFQFSNRRQQTSEVIVEEDVIEKESETEDEEALASELESDSDNELKEIPTSPGDDEHADIITELPNPRNLQRRFSLGKIPVPPKTLNYEDIKELADQAGASSTSPHKTMDPRRSSVTLDIYKSFKESNKKKQNSSNDQTIYVESKGRFKSMRKGTFNIERVLEKEKEDEDEKQQSFFVPFHLQDIGQAFHTQRSINQFALIVQGFLAGISVTLAVFAFNFTEDALFRNYQWMSLPVHAIFMIAFSIGLFTAIDRLGIYKTQHFYAAKHLRGALANNAFLGFIIWSVGLVSSLLCIRFDSSLYHGSKPDDQSIYFWRSCSIIRAVAAAIGWLLLAFKPDSDVVARQLKKAVLDSVKLDNKSQNLSEKREIVLKSLNML
ncbi:unnamed protein product [Caenorhabditis angaria]|uniref:Uncharacterized protein n=1 Tax=Caenorhabditis angaria TaxID=860376 RepID=A0A9P1N8T7_9PELO|nr:unnamed protein product [Caenorhabditis angaria]